MAKDSKREKHFLYNTLSILLKAVEKQRTTVDLRNEASVVGIIDHTDAYMNIVMKDCVFTDPRGDSFKFDMFFVQARSIRNVHIPMNSDMDEFKFTDYDCVGFDLDNTLLRYNVTNLVYMEYEMLARFLVDKRGYSEDLLKPLTDNDVDFMQKGLLLDFERGNVLRVSPDGVIRRACHGSRLLSTDQIREIYPEQKWEATDTFCRDVMATWNGPLSEKIRSLLDYFDIVASVAFARAVDALDEGHGSPLDRYNIWPDILDGLIHMFSRDHFQSNKGIFGHIKKNPEKYLRKCSSDTISWLKEVKKKSATFLLTGSNVDFASFTASYALGEDWRSLFDIVVCYARKPGFFINNRPFFDVINNNETDIASQDLKQGEIYSQGNWNDLLGFFARITGKTDQRCLYVGDNLVQDIYVPNAFAHCDTLAVIEEQMSEGMLHHALTHPDEKILNSKLWGSYFYLKDSTINVDSLWGHIIKKHAKLCIPDISLVTQRPLEEPIPCFDKDGKLYRGYYPAIPLSVSAIRIIPAIKQQLKQLSRSSWETTDTKRTFKIKRAQQRQQESRAAVEQILETKNTTKTETRK